MQEEPRIIAIGAGGFTHETDPALDDFVLAQCPVSRPRVGFIGAASDDDPQKFARFHHRFAGLVRATSHLPGAAPLDLARE